MTTGTTKTWKYITTFKELQGVRDILLEYLEKNKGAKLAVDIETSGTLKDFFPRPIKIPPGVLPEMPDGGWEGKIETLQIGCDPEIYDEQYVIDVRGLGLEAVTSYLKEVLEKPIILGHNLKYDVGFLIAQCGIWPRVMRDTMLISQLRHAGDKFPHTLGNLYRKYLDYRWFIAETGLSFKEYDDMKKRLQVSDWRQELTEEQLQYAADDVRLIFFLYRAMNEDLDSFCKRYRRSRIHDNIKFACKLIPEFALMEIRGIDFDKSYHSSKVIAYLEEKLREAQEEVGKFFTVTETYKTPLNKTDFSALFKVGLQPELLSLLSQNRGVKSRTKEEKTVTRPININSPKQVLEALRGIGLTPLNTTEDEIKRCKSVLTPGTKEHTAVSSILKAKKAASLLSKFGQALLDQVHPDGRIHPHIHQIGSITNGVDTLRSSSSDPNIMQMPMRDELFEEGVHAGSLFRRGFVALSGSILIDLDLSQIEPRMAAQITRDPGLIEELSKDTADLHALTAKILLGLDELPAKDSYERQYIGKTANLAMSYGIGPKKLAKFMYDETISKPQPVRWTVDQAKECLDRYYSSFSNIMKTMIGVQNRLAAAVEPYDSLADFKGKPIYIAFNASGAHRGWYLNKIQKDMADSPEGRERLRKDYLITEQVPLLDEFGDHVVGEDGKPLYETRKSKWNEWHKTMNRIAREAYNFENQSECALILKRAEYEAGLKLRSIADPLEYGIVAVVHDELLVRVPKDIEEESRKILTDAMIQAGQEVIKVVPVKVGVGTGMSWADAK